MVAAHQPCYLPWLGYFDKIARADLFVVLDDVQYEHQNFQNRNRLKVNNGVVWATVPVEYHGRVERVCDKRIVAERPSRQHWQRRTWRTLSVHYGRAPHFARYREELEEVYHRRWERLIDLDLHLLRLCLRWLGIARPMVFSSEIGVRGQKSELIRDLCRKTGANRYLSGCGGSREYLDVDALRRDGVEVVWQEYAHPMYPQRYPQLGFVPKLSVLDLVLNCGPESAQLAHLGDGGDDGEAGRELALPARAGAGGAP